MVFVDCTGLNHLRFRDGVHHLGTHVNAQAALLEANPDVSYLLMHAVDQIEDQLLNNHQADVMITVVAFCNSGQQRSVAVAETLCKMFACLGFAVEPVMHTCENWWCEAACMRNARRSTGDPLAVCDCCLHKKQDTIPLNEVFVRACSSPRRVTGLSVKHTESHQ